MDAQLLGGLFIAATSGVGIACEGVELGRAITSAGWPTVEGEIERTGVDMDAKLEAFAYVPVVRYHYRIGDREYVNDRIAFGGRCSSVFRRFAAAVATQYGKRSAVTVHVSPADPSVSVLEPGVHWATVARLGVFGVLLALGMQMLLAYFGIVPVWIQL